MVSSNGELGSLLICETPAKGLKLQSFPEEDKTSENFCVDKRKAGEYRSTKLHIYKCRREGEKKLQLIPYCWMITANTLMDIYHLAGGTNPTQAIRLVA